MPRLDFLSHNIYYAMAVSAVSCGIIFTFNISVEIQNFFLTPFATWGMCSLAVTYREKVQPKWNSAKMRHRLSVFLIVTLLILHISAWVCWIWFPD